MVIAQVVLLNYSDEDITEEIADELVHGEGFVDNVARATGHLFR